MIYVTSDISLVILLRTITCMAIRWLSGVAGIRSALTAAAPGAWMEDSGACGWMICRNSILRKESDYGI